MKTKFNGQKKPFKTRFTFLIYLYYFYIKTLKIALKTIFGKKFGQLLKKLFSNFSYNNVIVKGDFKKGGFAPFLTSPEKGASPLHPHEHFILSG